MELPHQNPIESHFYNAIHDRNNSLCKSDEPVLKDIYIQFNKLIIESFTGKTMENITSVFWMNIVIQMMVYVEQLPISGYKKKDLIMETIIIVIRNDLNTNPQSKVKIEEKFRKVSNNIIDIIIHGSKNIHTFQQKKVEPKKREKRRYCCCF